MNNQELATHARSQRRTIVEMVHAASSGHPGGSLSATDILAMLYFEVMDINADNLNTTDRDRFVLSKGHASPALYAVLSEKGFIDHDQLVKQFRQIDTNFQGHPNMNEVAGVDMSTGSLGQGLSAATGMALANKIDHKPYRVYALIGDGESEEGQIWEAAMAASHYQLDNLCVIVDYNHLQIDGNVDEVVGPSPLDEKFKAFGFHVETVDGHDFDQLRAAFHQARLIKHQPTAIIAKTTKGKGVSFMEDNASWHGAAPNDEQFEIAMHDLEEAQ